MMTPTPGLDTSLNLGFAASFLPRLFAGERGLARILGVLHAHEDTPCHRSVKTIAEFRGTTSRSRQLLRLRPRFLGFVRDALRNPDVIKQPGRLVSRLRGGGDGDIE
jgi:hypothetical protein